MRQILELGCGNGDTGPVRHVTLDQHDQAGRILLAFAARFGGRTTQCQPLAQQHDRPEGGGFQISLGPQRSQRSSEAASTIHCTSSSNVVPANTAGPGTGDVSVMPGWVLTSRQKRPPVPSMRSSKRKSATAHAPAAKRHMRRQR